MKEYFEFGSIRPLHYFFGISGFLGIVFALVSNNEQSSFALHLTLWLLQTTGPILLLVYTHIGLHKFRFFDKQNSWLKLFISGLLGALLFSPFALILDFLWGNDAFPKSTWSLFILWLDELSGVVPPVTISWMAINAPCIFGFKFIASKKYNNQSEDATKIADNTIETNQHEQHSLGIMSLIDKELIGDIIYLKSELHYLLVVGTKGKELVLYNLRDAVEDLSEKLGAQAHRSFWVNYAYITKVLKKGRQARIIMCNQDEIPVSRNNVDIFKAYF